MLRFSHQPLVFKAEGFSRQQLKRLENCAQRDDSRLTMKSKLIAIVAAVLVVGCGGPSAPDISIHDAAGAFGSPMLLQRSGVGPRALLESAGIEVKVDLPGVGQNFQDHAATLLLYNCRKLPTFRNYV